MSSHPSRPDSETEGARHDENVESDAAETADAEQQLSPAGESDESLGTEPAIVESPAESADSWPENAPEPGAELSALVEALQKESDEHRDKWLRTLAEFENFRKRARREMESSINLATANVLRQLLEVVDNFGRALSTAESGEEGAGAAFVEGVRLIYEQLMGILRQNGLVRIEAENAPFDPNLHEAISQIETEEVPSHHVAHVVQDGYLLNDLVLRPARVVVAK